VKFGREPHADRAAADDSHIERGHVASVHHRYE
jgi:hypothetical protein